MKKLILLLAVLLTSVSCLADNIEGDTNHDGVLSGSEQYLLENLNIEGTTPERVQRAIQKEKQRQEQITQWEDEDALNARQVQQRFAFAYQRHMDHVRHHSKTHQSCKKP